MYVVNIVAKSAVIMEGVDEVIRDARGDVAAERGRTEPPGNGGRRQTRWHPHTEVQTGGRTAVGSNKPVGNTLAEGARVGTVDVVCVGKAIYRPVIKDYLRKRRSAERETESCESYNG